jgi:hypothetical protein
VGLLEVQEVLEGPADLGEVGVGLLVVCCLVRFLVRHLVRHLVCHHLVRRLAHCLVHRLALFCHLRWVIFLFLCRSHQILLRFLRMGHGALSREELQAVLQACRSADLWHLEGSTPKLTPRKARASFRSELEVPSGLGWMCLMIMGPIETVAGEVAWVGSLSLGL